MPNPTQQTVSIPESITIGGVQYLVRDTPELQQFVKDVAKVEKNKLYSQFENLRAQIATLGNVQVTPDASADDIVAKLQESFVTKDYIEKTLPQLINDTIKPLIEANERVQLNEIEAYRAKLIKDNEATCIPELVKGKTKEELDAALAESIRIRAAYAPSAFQPQKPVHDPTVQQQAQQPQFQGEPTPPTPPAPAQQAQPTPPPAPTPQIPPVPRREAPRANGQSNVKQMTMKEFTSRRDNLLQELQSAYGGGGY